MNEYICEYEYEGKIRRIQFEAASWADADAHIKAICKTGTVTGKVEAMVGMDPDLRKKLFPLTSRRKTDGKSK